MLSTIPPSAPVDGKIHQLPPTTRAAQSLTRVLKCALDSVVSLASPLLTRRVFETVTEFLHASGIGQTRVAHLNVAGKSLLAKLECENATGSYKSRGAYFSVAAAANAGAFKLVTATTGNHGAGVNFAVAEFALPLKIFVPAGTPTTKLDRLRGPHTEIHPVPGDFAQAKRAALECAQQTGATYVAPYDSCEAVCGQATIGVELAALPSSSFDAVAVPIGGGGLIAGISAALWALGVEVPIYGVCVNAARSAYDSFHSNPRKILMRPTSKSLAEGVLVDAPGVLPWSIIDRLVKDIVVVDDDAVADAVAALHGAGIRAEGAGAVSAAAVIAGLIPATRPLCVVSGGNISDEAHSKILARAAARRQ
jgi:threonine dehydratase